VKNITHRLMVMVEDLKGFSRIDWFFLGSRGQVEFSFYYHRLEEVEDPVHGVKQHETDRKDDSRILVYYVHILDLRHRYT